MQRFLILPQSIKDLIQALRYLSGVCDGAVAKDHVGFNGIDSAYGRSMALSAENMTAKQMIAAADMIQKYRGQLESAGLTIPTHAEIIEAVKSIMPPNQNRLEIHEQRIRVYFSNIPDQEVRAEMKHIDSWRFEGEIEGKPWSFPVRYINQVITMFEKSHDIPEAVREEAKKIAEKGYTEPKSTRTIMLDAQDGNILVSFPGRPSDIELNKIKSLPTRKWRPELDGKPWEVPARLLPDLEKAFPNAQPTQALLALKAKTEKLNGMAKAETSDYRIDGLKGTPRPYQWAAMEFIEERNGKALVADDQGLGKCLEVYGYIQHHPELRPVVIVCPSSVKETWRREFYKWCTTDDVPETLVGQKSYPTAGTILIINYDILTHWKDYIRFNIQPKVVVSDESHYVKHPHAARSKALKLIVLGRDGKEAQSTPVPHFIATTGTPITNRPIEIWSALNLLDPKVWRSRHQFGIEYCGAFHNGFGWQYDGIPDVEKLNRDIRPYVLRRRKQDVLKELPPKIHIPLPLRLTPKAQQKYGQAVKDAYDRISRMEADGVPVGAEHLKLIETLKQITAEGKIDEVIDWISDVIENEKLIVFCTHTAIVDRLMTEFAGLAVEITGRVPSGKKRDQSVDAFMNDANIKLCVANIQAGGVGLTLTAASKVIFVEFPWNPKDIDQASDRIHRIGQTGQAMIYFAAGVGTIDETIVDLLVVKAEIIDKVMDGEATGQLSIIQEVIQQFMENARRQMKLGLDL